MRGLALLLLGLALALPAGPGRSKEPDAVAVCECAALYRGHWLYERAHFDPADVSAGWESMSQGFSSAARRLGATDPAIDAALARASDWSRAIEAHIMGGDPALAGRYSTQQSSCERLLRELPELKPYR